MNGANPMRVWLLALLLSISAASAQDYAALPDSAGFAQAELDQMLAPIALYPDALLSQVLMAATYPLEIVEAARWSQAHPELTGEQAVDAAQFDNWDPSVKSLLAFPELLAVMNERLDWTERLGNAFIAQQPQVMSTIQALRQRAYAAGSFNAIEPLRVESQDESLMIASARPDVVYVPYVDPLVVYGGWWWPAYPPVSWAPWRGYSMRPGMGSRFAWGVPTRVSPGFFFGGWDWRRHHAVVIHTPRHFTPERNRPPGIATTNAGTAAWQHNVEHRRGVPYRNPAWNRQPGRTNAAPPAVQETSKPATTAPAAVNRPESSTPSQRPVPDRQRPQKIMRGPELPRVLAMQSARTPASDAGVQAHNGGKEWHH
ncbi:MAG TPA: DUF3300 domain-containing protein [Burkholderiales bacterium]|nr:DUF3300 domain-containing protein [Burkholderiales bacterium]